ncbi:N-formylglutamate amidohydrolase [Rhodovarius lipocyclicus]|uniref:N-formylglutamate amidohydrolase n=1 Tax=Rhodovarius lipocyclicus TaxID=268410 RepID=UPI001F270220|nr:N-formylglutamate amidohydrolase [Rhodovarius lipocyclicus]
MDMNTATQELLAPHPALAADSTAFSLLRPVRALSPVIFASAHSGRDYPADFVAAARLDPVALRRSEDCFVDQLFAAAPELGAPLLLAHFPRAYCDANREPWELDPAMFEGTLPPWVNSASARVGAGLGTIARVVSTGEPIYRGKLPFAEAEARVRGCWQPYHAALAALIAETRAQFGTCILIDCHSMPSAPTVYGPLPDMVLGDAHGTTCAPRITRIVEQSLGGFGYRLARNDPYAGGYVTRHYGRPREGVHVLQLEMSRKLYMDEQRIEPNAGMERLCVDIRRLIAELIGVDWGFLR